MLTQIPIKADPAVSLMDVIEELCKEDFIIFQKVKLGMDIGDHHIQWGEDLKSGLDVVEMAPRDHGKSMSLARAYVIWKIVYDDWVKEVMLLGADQASAIENLDKIKEILEDSPYAHLVPDDRNDGINSRTELEFTNGKKIKSKGYLSRLRGRHPQLIVLDDVLNEKNSLTAEQRKVTKKYFFEVLFPMKDKGNIAQRQAGKKSQIVVVGTSQDADDLYHQLLETPGFAGRKLRAVVDEDRQMVLWPERYDYNELMKIKAAVGSISFSKEYQNDPLNEDTSIFPASLFEACKDDTLSYVPHYVGDNPVFMGVDFSVPGSSDGDWTVVFVWEHDVDNNVFIPLNYWRDKPDMMDTTLEQIEMFCSLYKVSFGYLEDNMFQKIFVNQIQKNTMLPLQGHTVTRAGKNSMSAGIISFRPLFENARIKLPYKTAGDKMKTDLLIKEFNGIVKKNGKIGNFSFHDDIVMAAWHCLKASENQTFKVSWV